MVMYPDIGMYTEANTCRISTTHNNAREGKAMKEEVENITGPRTPGAWLYAWAAIAAKYNERERRKVQTNREGRADKSFRLLRGKLR